jgi:FAD/FMN-containing dehydrogenase
MDDAKRRDRDETGFAGPEVSRIKRTAIMPSAADFRALARTIEGQLIVPGSPEYETLRKPAMVRFGNVRPAAIVRCKAPADVSEAVAFARRFGLQTATRSGGHSVAGRSSTEGLLIDVAPMRSLSVAGGVATVGAGVRLGGLYDALQEHGLTIPAGCGSAVGIAGLTLGGGIGILGRKYGLTCDHLRRAEVVMADGRVVACDEHAEAELFWALRGAGGGNFGVVTSFVFRTVPAPAAKVFHLGWPLALAARVVEAWQVWAPTAPNELDATLRLSAVGDGVHPPVVDLFGTMLSGEADAAQVLDDLVARIGAEPAWASHRHMSHREAKRYLDGLKPVEDRGEQAAPNQAPEQGPIFSKSEFFRRLLPPDTIAALVKNLTRGLAMGHSREIAFLPWGGAYNRVRAEDTAFVHRDERFLVQHLLVVDAHSVTTEQHAADGWLARSWALVHPWGSGGVYPNFPDSDLQDWPHAYYGRNYDRLLRVKAKYDPDNFFRFHQSLSAS